MTWERSLAQLMEKEQAILGDLLRCSAEKTDMLVKGEADAIVAAVDREHTLTMRFQAAEKQRLSLIREKRLFGKSLSEICRLADPEYRDILAGQQESLRGIVDEIKKVNELNSSLTKSRLEFYGKLRALYAKPGYGYTGQAQKQMGESAVIDRKV